MVVRVTPSGNQVPGTPAPASFANGVAGGWIGWVERTTDLASVVGTVQTLLTVTVTVNTSRRIRITGFVSSWISTVTDDRIEVRIMEGATQLQMGRSQTQLAGIATENPVSVSVVEAPTVGSHTYSLAVIRNGGSGSITIAGDNTSASTYLLVEDLGAQ